MDRLIFDAHAHYDDEKFDTDRDEIISSLPDKGIFAVVNNGVDIETSLKSIEFAEKYPFFYSAIGIHPQSVTDIDISRLEEYMAQIASLLDNDKVVAIGETGLDYHLARNEQHRIRQKMWFIYQLKLAHRKKLPVILHIREADNDAIRILKKYKYCLHGGVCHCFNGSAKTADIYTNLGIKLGIGGSLLMNTSKTNDLEQAIIRTSMYNILLETDGPYVKPECPDLNLKKLIKARNTSLILPAVAKRIAELKMTSVEEVMRITSENAVKLFNIGDRI